jgi:hypothetical protein
MPEVQVIETFTQYFVPLRLVQAYPAGQSAAELHVLVQWPTPVWAFPMQASFAHSLGWEQGWPTSDDWQSDSPPISMHSWASTQEVSVAHTPAQNFCDERTSERQKPDWHCWPAVQGSV